MTLGLLDNHDEAFFLVRLEHNERSFASVGQSHADGVVISADFSPPARGRATLKELALQAGHGRTVIDPATWKKAWVGVLGDELDSERLVPQRLSVAELGLDDDPAIELLTRDCLRSQADTSWLVAPYFKFASIDDPWLLVNLKAIQASRRLVPRRPTVAWISVSLEALMDGTLAASLGRYSAVLPRGATVVLTVSDLQPTLGPDVLVAYLSTIASFVDAGLRVVVDRASEIAVAAVALGAAGAMSGTRMYRTAPPSPLWTNDFNPRIPTSYFVSGRCDRMSLRDAERRSKRRSIPACRDPECNVASRADATKKEVRLHNAHGMAMELRHARAVGPRALAAEWRELDLKRLHGWANAVDHVLDRRKAA